MTEQRKRSSPHCMNLTRGNSVYISDKVRFYAHILTKALVHGTEANCTIDQYIDAELTDKWEREFPDLVLAWERNNELRQQNKKQYDHAEKEVLEKIMPVPGGKL